MNNNVNTSNHTSNDSSTCTSHLDNSYILNKHKLSLLNINAESLRNKIDQLQIESSNYDIIGISETWLNKEICNDVLNINGFQEPIRKDRPDGWGGVAMFVRQGITCKHRKDLDVQHLEAIWCEITHSNFHYLICIMYRPPNSNREYWELIKNSLENARMSSPDIEIFLMGDLNCDQLKKENVLLNILESFNLQQLIKEPTHVSHTYKTLIDIIACSSHENVASSGIRPPSLSNHHATYVTLRHNFVRKRKHTRHIWDFKKADWEKINKTLQETEWTFEDQDVTESALHFTTKFIDVMEMYIPRKEITICSNDKPWITKNIHRIRRQKNNVHRKAKSINSANAWAKFREKRNNYNNKIKEAKLNYEKGLADQLITAKSEDSKLWWKTLNYFTGNKKYNNTEQPLTINGISVLKPKEKAEAFNNFFTLQSELEISDTDKENLKNPEIPNTVLTDINITVKDIEDILKSIDTKKATGPDGISPKMLKATAKTIAPILQRLFQNSLDRCCFPDNWKIANITPLHKKGAKDIVSNYRPISLISCLGKIMEKCVFKYVMNFLRKNKILTDAQAAYIGEGSSTVTQLTEIYHEVLKNLEDGTASHFVFCDASRAFDRVWHDGVLFKLQQCGITGKLNEWFKNYLQNRGQRVVINGEESSINPIHAGVPQGSILGPLLFLVYVNDLPNNINSQVKMYADDTSLLLPSKNIDAARQILNEDLETLHLWSKKWHVLFNPEKTVSMTISRKAELPLDVEMDRVKINQVTSHKHLGVVIQNNGKWTEHVKELATKTSQKVDQLRSLMHKLDKSTLQTMYFTYIRPSLEYASLVWGNCCEKDKKTLEDVQLAAARVVTSATKGTSHDIIYNECKWELLEERRKKQRLKMVFKMKNNLCPETLQTLLPIQMHQRTGYNLRGRNNLIPPKSRTNAFSNSFIPQAIKEWNLLSDSIREQATLFRFNKKLGKPNCKIKNRYLVGSRTSQIMLARMKLGCSGLNEHLFLNHIEESRACDCGDRTESAEHFILKCSRFDRIRNEMLLEIPSGFKLTESILLNGDDDETETDNEKLFTATTKFVTKSKRFT